MSELKAVTEYMHDMLVLTITFTMEDGKVIYLDWKKKLNSRKHYLYVTFEKQNLFK